MNKSPLSSELKVACEIYHYNLLNEPIWFDKLSGSLSSAMNKKKVSTSIDTLFDWGIIKAEYGETVPGRSGRLLIVTNESEDLVRDLYKKYWKENRL
jgi:hypothetical protein